MKRPLLLLLRPCFNLRFQQILQPHFTCFYVRFGANNQLKIQNPVDLDPCLAAQSVNNQPDGAAIPAKVVVRPKKRANFRTKKSSKGVRTPSKLQRKSVKPLDSCFEELL